MPLLLAYLAAKARQVVGALARAGFREGTASSLAQNLGALTNFDPKAMAQIISALELLVEVAEWPLQYLR